MHPQKINGCADLFMFWQYIIMFFWGREVLARNFIVDFLLRENYNLCHVTREEKIMAFDGICVAALTYELQKLCGGRISKIAQPEKDELLLTVKTNESNERLLISASASLPFLALTDENKPSPAQAPSFCMTLRKYIAGGRIASISQSGLERVITFTVTHLNELGDPAEKKLIVELMGKYSNIILVNEEDMIIDSIKHVPLHISSLREVLPGKRYFFPDELKKEDPLTASEKDILDLIGGSAQPVSKTLMSRYSGISGQFVNEFLGFLNIDDRESELTGGTQEHIAHSFIRIMDRIKERDFKCGIYKKGDEPKDFSALVLFAPDYQLTDYDSPSRMIFDFYDAKSRFLRMRDRSSDLRKKVKTLIERCSKKIDIYEKQLKDSEKKDEFKLCGELLSAYAYSLPQGEKKVTVNDYNTGKDITINLDADLSIIDNAKKYFAKYGKAKRTEAAATAQLSEARSEMEHLLSIDNSLSFADDEADLKAIQREMAASGYIKKIAGDKKGEKKNVTGKPYHYVTEDGYHIYVGKNNYQNDELTFDFANGNDMWFHAKGIPGSHVIVKTDGRPLPDHIYEIAGAVAAYYSSNKGLTKTEVDYIERKHVKKTPGGKPGFVIYHTNYSLVATPSLEKVELVKD